MTGPGMILREIHRIRRHAKDLAVKIEQAPRLVKTQEKTLARHEDKLRETQDNIKLLKVHIHEKETSIRAIQTAIKKHQKQRDEAGNKKEYDALQLEIQNEKQSIVKLEDESLQDMTRVEELSAQIPALEKALQQAKADFAKFQTDQEERLKRYAVERDQAQEALVKVETGLPEDLLVYYQREVKGRGEDALSMVENRTCTACYTEITAQMYNELSRDMFVKCKSCGRILYLPE